MIRIRDPKEFWTGVLFIAIGCGAMLIGMSYPMGSAANMGPGYFPRVLGAIMAILGLPPLLRGVRVDGPRVGAWPWKSLGLVLGSVVMFGVLVPRVGLVLGSLMLIVGSGLAAYDLKVKRLLVFAVSLATFAAGVFVYALNIPLPLWPWSWN